MHKMSCCCYSFVPFEDGSPNPNAQFALGFDIYAHIPYDKQKKYNESDHALALWLDIQTQEWVARKECFKMQVKTISKNGIMFFPGNKKTFVEVYRGNDYQEALNQCTILNHKFWTGSEMEYIACTHTHEMYCCKKNKDKYAFRGIA